MNERVIFSLVVTRGSIILFAELGLALFSRAGDIIAEDISLALCNRRLAGIR